ncbi:GNAT family N-acetyltransferase [Microvirga lotononidis]|uniref:GNAT family N-acetyltransferase n=1 Tax=Microvirga lotononidis TaxID=864069 RepID=UPI0009FDDB96|nr:GNAT family N-acetyltransferase [Microvirga lotononidis]WQO31051.1 GNAT family N-acetyltransferase [Microvirga lotononidis]
MTRSTLSLRDATDDDIPFAWKLYSDHCRPVLTPFLGGHWDEVQEQQKFRTIWRPEMTKVIQFGSSCVGWLSTRTARAEVILENLYIAKRFRGRGIGSTILREIIDIAASNGRSVQLEALKETAAVEFYKKLGFERIGVTEMTVEMKYQFSTKLMGGHSNVPQVNRGDF